MPVLSFLLFAFVNSFTPGPNNFMALSFANQYGFKKTIQFSAGVSLGFSLLVLICSFFNHFLIQIFPVIQTPLTILGVLYMLYLAYKILTSTSSNANHEATRNNLFILGIFLQFINPKGLLYGIMVVTTFLLPYYSSYMSFILFSIFLGAVGFVSTATWGLFGTILQKYLVKYQLIFNIVMALLLVYSALMLIFA